MMGISLQHKDIFILTFLMIIIKIKNIQYYFIFMGMGIQDMYKNMSDKNFEAAGVSAGKVIKTFLSWETK